VLAGAGAALRALSPGTAGFEPTLFVSVVAGRVLGAGFGFALGPVVIMASALVTGGVGPWMPYQMIGLGWVGLVAGCLPRVGVGTGPGRWRERWLLAVYAAVASFGYGALLNLSFWPFTATLPAGMAYVPTDPVTVNLGHYVAFYVTTSLAWDCVRAGVNAALIVVAGRPVLATLRRAARRAAFDVPPAFAAGSTAQPAPAPRSAGDTNSPTRP
jgi:energy-coupling factor transport system substrate-specific component